ncbi:hypothetical protein PENTCL1PPCAC_27118, partial [Pristionchus entomophagus]
ARFFLPLLLVASSITAQSEEFLRLKKELEGRIAALRPEAREVAERLKSVFEARLPKKEAKARLNAVLESASEAAKAALETLKPDRKIDVEVVIPLPEEPVTDNEVERILGNIAIPGIDKVAAAAERLNLTDKTLSEALKENPNLAAQLGIDRPVLDKIEHLVNERGLANNTIDNVLQNLRYNLSLVLNSDERSTLEKFANERNIPSLEALFENRLGGGPRNKTDARGEFGRFRNASDEMVDDLFGGRFSNHSGDFIDRFFNGTDRNFVEKIRERFGYGSSFLDKFFSNATGDFEGFTNVSEKTIRKLLDGLSGGNFSLIDRLLNGTDSSSGNGTLTKIKEAFKSGNFSAIMGGTKNGSSFVDTLKSLLNISSLPSGGSSSDSSGGPLSNLGSAFTNITSSFKNLFG